MIRNLLSRRQLLSGGVAIGSAAALLEPSGLARGHSISGEMPWAPGTADNPKIIASDPFFSDAERKFIDAATARLIPTDETGPGAREAGVTQFIDAQLAGPFGKAERWYMRGPWKKGADTQGYQSRFSPAELYRAAIKAIDAYVASRFKAKSFANLTPEQQDQTLSGIESGDIELAGVDGKTFFDMLLQNTIEGFFSDPIYGGNRDMVGWKMIGFPGARYDYRPYVQRHGERLGLAPVGIKGRPAWTPQE